MYTAFYGLREKPFMLSPNPRYLYLGESHREALAHLLYGIEQGEGFIAITGEVGTGKTTLCRTLLERLGPATDVAFLFNPSRSAMELLQTIAQEFGLPVEGLTRRELRKRTDLLAEFDTDGNSALDELELDAAVALIGVAGVDVTMDDFFERWDLDRDGQVDKDELPLSVALHLRLGGVND